MQSTLYQVTFMSLVNAFHILQIKWPHTWICEILLGSSHAHCATPFFLLLGCDLWGNPQLPCFLAEVPFFVLFFKIFLSLSSQSSVRFRAKLKGRKGQRLLISPAPLTCWSPFCASPFRALENKDSHASWLKTGSLLCFPSQFFSRFFSIPSSVSCSPF